MASLSPCSKAPQQDGFQTRKLTLRAGKSQRQSKITGQFICEPFNAVTKYCRVCSQDTRSLPQPPPLLPVMPTPPPQHFLPQISHFIFFAVFQIDLLPLPICFISFSFCASFARVTACLALARKGGKGRSGKSRAVCSIFFPFLLFVSLCSLCFVFPLCSSDFSPISILSRAADSPEYERAEGTRESHARGPLSAAPAPVSEPLRNRIGIRPSPHAPPRPLPLPPSPSPFRTG